jgi:hypothetical protein
MGYPMNREHRLFAQPATFEEAFPTLADARVEYREEGRGAGGEARVALASDDSLDGLIPCSNPHCKQGGFEIDLVFHEMIAALEESRQGALACPGTERVGTIVTDETEATREFFTSRLEHEVEEYEHRTGKTYAYDGTLTTAIRTGEPRSTARCGNALRYRITLTYRPGAGTTA